jgi:hypothetical protein
LPIHPSFPAGYSLTGPIPPKPARHRLAARQLWTGPQGLIADIAYPFVFFMGRNKLVHRPARHS